MTARAAERLRRLLGDWELSVEGELADGRRVRGKGTARGESAVGGGALVTMRVEMDGPGSFEETNLFGYSAEEERVHQFSVTSLGEAHDHEGVWETEDRLYVEWNGISGGRPVTEKIRYEWRGEDLVAHATEVTAGKVQGTYVYRLVRTGPAIEEPPMAVPS